MAEGLRVSAPSSVSPRAAGVRMVVGCLAIALPSCASLSIVVEQPTVEVPPPPGRLRAGAFESDITPPPGPPVWGSSSEGAREITGYRQRLKLRAILFEDRRGERLAIVQADLGASSGLLHREIARRVASLGIGPDRLLLASTHTHAGPGGYFGAAFYNTFAPARAGFDRRLLDFLAERASAAITEAERHLSPARLGVGTASAPGLSRNRSRVAWEWNFRPLPPLEREDVDRTVRLLRVDRDEDPAATIAAIAIFAIHPTSAGAAGPFAHGDLMGVAADALKRRLAPGSAGVFAILNGPEGDVSPNWEGWPLPRNQGFAEAVRLGGELAAAAEGAFQAAGRSMKSDVLLSHAYREVSLPRAATSEGPLCDRAEVGVSAMSGAEDIRSFANGWFGIIEGARREGDDCQAPKRRALGFLQRWLASGRDFVRLAPFQIFVLGEELVLAAVPGEPTTETGRNIAKRVREALPAAEVAVVSHGNEYMGYAATAAEYQLQQYEGGSTLYGAHTAALWAEQAGELAASIHAGNPIREFDAEREFRPGRRRSFWERRRPCNAKTWSITDVAAGKGSVAFGWRGPRPSETCGGLPALAIECGDGQACRETDDGPGFEVSHVRGDHWRARWSVPKGLSGVNCRLLVSRPDLPPLERRFTLP